MNNGILTAYDTKIDNPFFFTNRSLSYANYELGKNSTILGPQESTALRNYNNGVFNRVVPSNHIGVPYINNGILSYNNSQNLNTDNSYIFLIDTASPNFSNGYYITANEPTSRIPHVIMGFGYRGVEPAIVDWGDGQFENLNTSYIGKTYRQHGVYLVQVSPVGNNFGSIYNPPLDGRNDFRDGKVVGILAWPKKTTSLLTTQFWGRCDFVPPYLPTGVTTLSLYQCNCEFRNMEYWDVSRITTFNLSSNSALNRDLSDWVFNNSITSLASFFISCSIFNNGDPFIASPNFPGLPLSFAPAGNGLKKWNVSNITNMSAMFFNCFYFNQNLDGWDVSKVTNFSSMFGNNGNRFYVFDGDLTGWQLAPSGVNCTSMFGIDIGGQNRGRLFTGKGVDGWNTSGVINMRNMFGGNILFNKNLSGWNTANVTDMSYMFTGCSSFVGSGLDNWNTGNVTSISNTFSFCSNFNTNINNWNTTNVTNMSNALQNATSFNQPLNNWNVRKVTNFSNMFAGASSFNSSLSGWAPGADTAGASCASMFADCPSFNQDIGNWDVSKVTNMNYMFGRNTVIVSGFNNGGSPSISGWNTSNVTNMALMFANINNFNQPIGSWNVSKVTTMTSMLQNAMAFNQDISGWNLAGLNANTSLDSFMSGKVGANALSTANYDALLIGWNNNKLVGANGVANWRTDLRPNFGGAKYTAGGDAATARAALVSYGWTITDGGTA